MAKKNEQAAEKTEKPKATKPSMPRMVRAILGQLPDEQKKEVLAYINGLLKQTPA